MNIYSRFSTNKKTGSLIIPIIILLFLVFYYPADIYSQGKIKGRITDSHNDQPLQYANVVLLGTKLGSATDEHGDYEISNIPAGVYTVQASYIGYEPGEVKSVSVINGRTAVVNVELRETAHSLSEVIVTPGHYSIIKNTPGSKVSFTKENIKSTALFGGDIYRAVTRLPGITGTDYTSKFTVRGGETDEVLVLFDGLELYDPFHIKDFGGVLSIIPVEAIGGIDLLTGGYPAEFGRRKSAVFNIKSESGPLDKMESTIGLSFMNASYLAQGPIGGDRGRWMISVRRGFIDLALKLTGEGDDLLPEYYDIFGKIEYDLNDDHNLSLHFLRAGDKLKFVDNDSLGSFSNSGYINTYAWANLESYLGDDLYIQSVLSSGLITHDRKGTIYDERYSSYDLGVNDNRDFKFVGLKQDWNYSIFRRLLLKAGAEYKKLWAEYDYNGVFARSIVDPGSVKNDPYYVDTMNVNIEPVGEEIGAYFSTRFKVMNSLYAETGIRYDKQSYTGAERTSPRVNLAYSLGSNTVIKAGWGRFYQSQGIHELWVQDGNLNFYEPEKSEHRIVGIEHKLGNGIELRLDAYKKDLRDFYPRYINIYNTIDAFEEASGDRKEYKPDFGESKGVEFFLKRDTGGEYTWWLSYSYSSAKDRFVYRDTPKSFDQTHTVDFNLNYRPSDKWRFNLAWLFHTGWPYTNAYLTYEEEYIPGIAAFLYSAPEVNLLPYNQSRFPDYHRMDIRITRNYEFEFSKLGVYIEFINVYNRQNTRCREYVIDFPDRFIPPEIKNLDHYWLRFIPSIGITWER
ncbi:MAG: TonB-dependent receptor [bacterium]|nr:TonB-dependent receptor [bacterium]